MAHPVPHFNRTALILLLVATVFSGCSRTDAYILAHGSDMVKCYPKDKSHLTCGKCKEGVYQDPIIPTTVPKLLAGRDAKKPTFFMFLNSGCHGFPVTMPPYLEKVQSMDSFNPVLVVVDDYSSLPTTRARIAAWGWKGPVHVLDQGHYGCYRYFPAERDSLVLEEFHIQEAPGYHRTVSLEVMVDLNGRVIGYSNWLDLPGELRGKNIPK